MATIEDVHSIAMSLPGTTLDPRGNGMTFRRQRIFAVLPGDGTVLLRLPLKRQAIEVEGNPGLFAPFRGQGPKGITVAQFAKAEIETLKAVLEAAWENAGDRHSPKPK